jgi:HAD superfamily hydrolase (TIGR01509 family)
MGSTSPLRAAVFDFDGLLVDSQPAWDHAYRSVAAAHGQELELDQLGLAGASVEQAAERLSGALSAEVVPARLQALIVSAARTMAITARPGARTLVPLLARLMPLAVASNGPRELVDLLLREVGLASCFVAVVTAAEVSEAKPAPDVYLEACRRLAVGPADAAALEDSATGAAAARAAGLHVVAIPSGGESFDAELEATRLDSPEVLRFFGFDPTHAQLDRLYDMNQKVAAVFWDWRQKLVALLFTAVSVAGFAWVSFGKDAGPAVRYFLGAGLLAVVAVLAVACWSMERRNSSILRQTYEVGDIVERIWGLPAVFSYLKVSKPRHSRVVLGIFASTAVLSVAAAIGLLVLGIRA